MWNVLHVAPNGEPQVCKYLGLHGIEGYAPQFPPPTRTRAGSVRDRRRRWVFPGYVFCKIADGFTQWDLIRWAPGVRRMLQEDVLHVAREDVEATADDEVLLPVHHVQVAVGVETADVAGVQPAAAHRGTSSWPVGRPR